MRLFAWWMAWRFFRNRPRYTFDQLYAQAGSILKKGTLQTGLLTEGPHGLQWAYLPGKVRARDVQGVTAAEHGAVWLLETHMVLAAARAGVELQFRPVRKVVWYRD